MSDLVSRAEHIAALRAKMAKADQERKAADDRFKEAQAEFDAALGEFIRQNEAEHK